MKDTFATRMVRGELTANPELLAVPVAVLVRDLVAKYGTSRSQARRYVRAARSERAASAAGAWLRTG